MLIQVSNIKLQGNPSRVSRVDANGQTDGHDEINGLVSRLRKHA